VTFARAQGVKREKSSGTTVDTKIKAVRMEKTLNNFLLRK
jgi:hypothetical protein